MTLTPENQTLLNEAIRIGYKLLPDRHRSFPRPVWQSQIPADLSVLDRHNLGTIYSGLPGIILFLIELYRHTQDAAWLQAAGEYIDLVKEYSNRDFKDSDSFAFYTGRMGMAYAMLKMSEMTLDLEYLEQALRIAKPCAIFLENSKGSEDLINGTSGTLLGLLHLYAASKEAWLLDRIQQYVSHLLKQANHGRTGLYWQRRPYHIKGLCGFSHGAAGLGFVFLELGHYFQNPALSRVAEQAFLYETQFFNPLQKNWLDLRKIRESADYGKLEQAYLNRDQTPFVEGVDTNVWCHGAAGIGLSRLRAYQLLDDKLYLDEAKAAISKVQETLSDPSEHLALSTLCHGLHGLAEIFLEGYTVLGESKYLAMAEAVALKVIEAPENKRHIAHHEEVKTDNSLFNGIAGAGYFYLRVLDPVNTPSILIPSLKTGSILDATAREIMADHFSVATVNRHILGTIFDRTICQSSKLYPNKLHQYLSDIPINRKVNLKEVFINFIHSLPQAENERSHNLLHNVFELELKKAKLDDSIPSLAWLHVQELHFAESARILLTMESDVLKNQELCLAPHIVLLSTCLDDNFPREAELPQDYVLLQARSSQIVEEYLSPFAYKVLQTFSRKMTVGDALENIVSIIAPESPILKTNIKALIIDQIKSLTKAGYLVKPLPQMVKVKAHVCN